MRVVVTRPETSGSRTAALLRDNGHEAVLLPLARPVHNVVAVSEALQKSPASLAATSAEAIRALQASDIELSHHLPRPLFVVGPATGQAAERAGFRQIVTGKGDGLSLAQVVVERWQRNGSGEDRLLYLAGTPRDAGFEAALAKNNIPHDAVEAYRMQAIAWERDAVVALLHPHPDAVLLYSRQTARIFFDLVSGFRLERHLERSLFICISEKVRMGVPERFREKAVASSAPSEAGMFELLHLAAGT